MHATCACCYWCVIASQLFQYTEPRKKGYKECVSIYIHKNTPIFVSVSISIFGNLWVYTGTSNSNPVPQSSFYFYPFPYL